MHSWTDELERSILCSIQIMSQSYDNNTFGLHGWDVTTIMISLFTKEKIWDSKYYHNNPSFYFCIRICLLIIMLKGRRNKKPHLHIFFLFVICVLESCLLFYNSYLFIFTVHVLHVVWEYKSLWRKRVIAVFITSGMCLKTMCISI